MGFLSSVASGLGAGFGGGISSMVFGKQIRNNARKEMDDAYASYRNAYPGATTQELLGGSGPSGPSGVTSKHREAASARGHDAAQREKDRETQKNIVHTQGQTARDVANIQAGASRHRTDTGATTAANELNFKKEVWSIEKQIKTNQVKTSSLDYQLLIKELSMAPANVASAIMTRNIESKLGGINPIRNPEQWSKVPAHIRKEILLQVMGAASALGSSAGGLKFIKDIVADWIEETAANRRRNNFGKHGKTRHPAKYSEAGYRDVDTGE